MTSAITEVNIPDSVTNINAADFKNCINLKTVNVSTFDIDKNHPSLYTDENLINEFLNEDDVDDKIKPELPFEDFKVGMKAHTSKTITETDVILFAGVSTDINPVHLDEEAAKKGIFGKRQSRTSDN